jgi:cofilin
LYTRGTRLLTWENTGVFRVRSPPVDSSTGLVLRQLALAHRQGQAQTRPTATDAPCSVSVTPECITAFNELKLGKSLKWIIFKISDDWKEIVVEETSTESNYDAFREKLLSAKSKDRKGVEGIGGRYAVYDVEYDAPGGEGKRSKITFISWVPDDATQYVSTTLGTQCHVPSAVYTSY